MKNSTEMKYYIWVDEPDTIIFSVKTLWKRIGFSEVCEDYDTKTNIKNQHTHSEGKFEMLSHSIRGDQGGGMVRKKWWWHKGKGQWQVISFLFLLSFKETASTNGLEEPQHHQELILTGLSDDPHIQALLFVLFLVIYLLTWWGT